MDIHRNTYRLGFTLSELLIALGILGVIATFTIPKIIDAGQEQRYNSAVKEVASTVAAAYQTYKLNNTVSASTGMKDLTAYINYIANDTSSTVDYFYYSPGGASYTINCTFPGWPCYRMHNGAMLYWQSNGAGFTGTNSTNAIQFFVDPDVGRTDASSMNGSGKACLFILYYDGKLRLRSDVEPNTVGSFGTINPPGSQAYTPPYLSWN